MDITNKITNKMKKLLFILALLFSCTFCFGQTKFSTPFIGQNIDSVEVNVRNVPTLRNIKEQNDSIFDFIYDNEIMVDEYRLTINPKTKIVTKVIAATSSNDKDFIFGMYRDLKIDRKYYKYNKNYDNYSFKNKKYQFILSPKIDNLNGTYFYLEIIKLN